jgi:hypothetical protein
MHVRDGSGFNNSRLMVVSPGFACECEEEYTEVAESRKAFMIPNPNGTEITAK